MRELTPLMAASFGRADAEILASLLKALADPTRLQIISLLHHEGPMGVNQIRDRLGRLTQPTVSHHVHILDEAGLLTQRRESVFMLRSLDADALAALVSLLGGTGRA